VKDTREFGLLVLVVALAGLAAVLSNRVAQRVRIPLPVIFLIAAALARQLIGAVHAPSHEVVERVVTIALLLILFDGGRQIGWSRFREAAGPIVIIGVAGTFLTAAATALLIHAIVGLAWFPALLVATAVSPTDPAIVFSVLGPRQIAGRASTILEGESGANDPVGIALMAGLISAGGVSVGAFGHVGGSFLLQMGVGGVVGVLGGWGARRLSEVSLPSEGLYPLRTLAIVLALYGVATVARGSGFLAVFIAGIVLADTPAPFKREIERFHAALASLGEIVAFAVLGLATNLETLTHANVWIPGLVIGALLAVVVRPLLVGACLLPARLGRNEQAFVLFAGLKGAVPILLGTLILAARVPHAGRLFGIIVVIVLFSVVVQGSLVPVVASHLKLEMRVLEPEPFAVGVRLQDQPDTIRRLTVAAGAFADGEAIHRIEALTDQARISLVVRNSSLVPIHGDTILRAGDSLLVSVESPPDLDILVAATAAPRPSAAGRADP
jgi:cell volume regulation protein A